MKVLWNTNEVVSTSRFWERREQLGVPVSGLIAVIVLLFLGRVATGDTVYLKNGIVLEGTAVQVPGMNAAMASRNVKGNVRLDSFWLIDDGVRRFFVHRNLVEDILANDELAQNVTFTLKHTLSGRKAGPAIVGGFIGMEPFDRFGRRIVMLSTQDGTTSIVQGITELRPDYFTVQGLTHQWEYTLDTKTLPPDTLLSLIEQASDRTDPAERKAAVTFFLQAEMLSQAQLELDRIAEDFPELETWATDFQDKIFEAKARSAFLEVESRRQAGQHQLANLIAKATPVERVSAEVARQSQEILAEYDKARSDRDTVLLMLDMLQAELDEQQADRLRPLRATLLDELRFATMSRLNPFLRSQHDETLRADQKLALAYSGWILGEANASLDLNEAILLWEARFHVLEFLRNMENPLLDDDMVEKLTNLEYVSIERVVQMIPLLPAPLSGPLLQPGEVVERDVPLEASAPPARYSLMLPPEYSPHREYPLLVVMRPAGRSYEDEIRWWAGNDVQQGWAQRRGYIVIAPHYCDDVATSYGGNPNAHQIVTASIEDVRQRYRVDSDRVFLGGHGMGADACFDIGMSRPDWFAGVIPITGECGQICNYYWENSPQVGWYLVNGERDRHTLDTNANVLNRMMRHGQNVIYCDYKTRGYESYHEEQERIFQWMQLQRRSSLSELKEWEASTLRLTDDRFYWLDASGLRQDLFPVDPFQGRKKTIYAKARLGNQIYVQVPGTGATIWLSPELIDFSERVEVRLNSRRTRPDFVQPSIRTLLTRLRETGDRQRLYWAKIEL